MFGTFIDFILTFPAGVRKILWDAPLVPTFAIAKCAVVSRPFGLRVHVVYRSALQYDDLDYVCVCLFLF